MSKPIFTQDSLTKIAAARAAANNDVVPTGDEYLLRVTRDRADIGIPLGMQLVARPAKETGEWSVAVVVLDGEHVLRRTPVTEGTVVGVIVGRWTEEAEASA